MMIAIFAALVLFTCAIALFAVLSGRGEIKRLDTARERFQLSRQPLSHDQFLAAAGMVNDAVNISIADLVRTALARSCQVNPLLIYPHDNIIKDLSPLMWEEWDFEFLDLIDERIGVPLPMRDLPARATRVADLMQIISEHLRAHPEALGRVIFK